MKRRVSIVVPCRNELGHIRIFIESVLAQNLPGDVALEILIADGMSDDGTREILDQYAEIHPSIRIVSNPARIVSCGLNRLIALAAGDTIIRMDVHARYASDYVAQCLETLEKTGADNVGGPARTEARGYLQQAISAAYHSSFACGGARFHDTEYEGYVDTVTFGCWRKEAFNRFGLFDEAQIRNQDDEHNLRLSLAGGRIFQSPHIKCWYAPRSSLAALFRQYNQYGYWKVRLIRKHGRPASVRHLVPVAFVGTLALLGIAAPFSGRAAEGLALVLAVYMLCSLIASVGICLGRRIKLLPVMPLVLATYHLSYGLGFLEATFRFYCLDTIKTPNSGAV